MQIFYPNEEGGGEWWEGKVVQDHYPPPTEIPWLSYRGWAVWERFEVEWETPVRPTPSTLPPAYAPPVWRLLCTTSADDSVTAFMFQIRKNESVCCRLPRLKANR